MRPDTQGLTAILTKIERTSREDRYLLHEPLMAKIHELHAAGHPVPPRARAVAEELLLDLTEARFDNMPV